MPAVQEMQVLAEEARLVVEYVPAVQAMQTTATSVEYLPGTHLVQTVSPAAEYVPAAQEMQVLFEEDPLVAE